MRLTLEHSDVIKALALYVGTKGFTVEAIPENFVIQNESKSKNEFDLVITVKNADTVVVKTSVTRAPSTPSNKISPLRLSTSSKKNDLFTPVAPPQIEVPQPKHRVLDKRAASSTALMSMSGYMPAPSGIIHDYKNEKKAEELIDEPSPSTSSEIIVEPSQMSEEDKSIFQDVLSRSAQRLEDGPVYADDAAESPVEVGGLLEE